MACSYSQLIQNYEFYRQVVGYPGRGSAIAKVATYARQHKQRKKQTYSYASTRILTHCPSVQVGEDISCLKSTRPL
jgi:hypothetical protein